VCFLNAGYEQGLCDSLPDGVVALDPSVIALPDPSEDGILSLPDSIVRSQVDLPDGECASDPQPLLPHCQEVKLGLRRLRPGE
jgi:hypothetical protein